MTFRAICTAAVSLAFLGCASEAVAQAKPDAAKPAPAKKAADTKSEMAAFAAKYRARLCTDGAKCEVSITAGPNCALTFDPYVLGVHRSLRNIDVRWNINTKDSAGKVEFPKGKGIFFKTEGAVKSGEFETPKYVSATQYKSKDKNSGFSDNPYGVNVMQDDKACPTYDPSVINGE
jgi:hypothetical protein